MLSDIGISSVICLIVSYIQGTESLQVQSEFNQTGALNISWEDQKNVVPKATEFVWVGSNTRVLWPWGEVKDSTVVVKDALRHDTVQLQIMRQYRNLSYTEFQIDVKVQKQFLSEGENGTMTWYTQENLNDGGYFITHNMEKILEIGRNNTRSDNPEKYVYNSDPTVSGLVRFQIKGVTPGDFGSYRGGTSRGSSREGTFVLVYGQPKKPTIIGQNKVSVGDLLTLSCSSTSTSQPAEFRGFPIMTYEWFEDGTSISLEKVLRLKVENSLYKKSITCRAKEELLSELSDPVQIEKPHCMTNITTSFVEGSARFSWSVPEASLGEMSTEVLVTRDGDPGNWTPVRNQSYTVRDCLTFSTIEIDVRFLSSQKEIALCRGLFTKLNKPDAFIKQKGRDATLNWTIPFFPSSKLYSIFKHSDSDKMEGEIIRVEDNKVTPINMENTTTQANR
uniref:Uncharacterized protein LOC111131516 n=1 Tax=Crassostrea virginica TaxID=6565 RepID=A0A8B8E3M4_CRAVI|nr:uncharacterized protein LOC111131516 [Crassostrea virginica]XP_022334805.1 uncharacterized protein LOC111131516 [Crassostrea virginica]XP_022334806.1 uncharacterized protein LOC111131516 [Crassostrea virginica]